MSRVNQLLLTLFITLGLITVALAAGPTDTAKQSTQVMLYAGPSTNKVLNKISPTVSLVPIFQKGDWIKVGNSATGQVGWINRAQYNKVLDAYSKAKIHSFYIYSSNTDNHGKPTINIVAYENGKLLPHKEAQKMYKRLQAQQQANWRTMRAMDREMAHWMARPIVFFHAPFFWQPAWENTQAFFYYMPPMTSPDISDSPHKKHARELHKGDTP